MNLLKSALPLLFWLIPFTVHAELSKKDVSAFVNEAAAYIEQVGQEKALAEFDNKSGQFVRGELYIFAYDFTGTVRAHGAKKLAGLNLMKLKDAKGNRVIQLLAEKAQQEGSGWVEYWWENPQKKKVMKKIGYVKKIDDKLWIGSGIYHE